MGRPTTAVPIGTARSSAVPVSGGSPTVLASFNGSNGAKSLSRFDAQRQHPVRDDHHWRCRAWGRHGFRPEHCTATIALSNASNATIITGGTATLGTTVSNSPSSGYNLNYTLTAAVQSGSATLGTVTSCYRQSCSWCKPILHRLGHFHQSRRQYDFLHRQ